MIQDPYKIIRGGVLIDCSRARAEPADILVKWDTIVEIGKPGSPAPEGAELIDATKRLLHPGLISAHTHGHGNFAKGLGDRWTFDLLQAASPWIAGGFNLDERYLAAYLGAVEMALKGCTACYDMNSQFPIPTVEGLSAVGKAYRDVGIRAVVAPMAAEYSYFKAFSGLYEALSADQRTQIERFNAAPRETILEAIRQALKGWSFDYDAVRPGIAPAMPHHCSDEFLVGCNELARDFGVGLQTHIQESKTQLIVSLQKYGKTQIAHLEQLGLLGPQFTAGHGVWIDDDDMRRLASHGCSVAHNPGSNMRLGSGLADTRGMLQTGINVAIGTDGAFCSDNLNMYTAMRAASHASNLQHFNSENWLSSREILAAATIGGAQALGFEGKLGLLKPGFKADIVFLDLDHVNWMPFNNASNQVVHAEDGTAVDKVMVGGRLIVEDRKVVGLDMAALSRRVEAARTRLRETNAKTQQLCEELAGVVSAFCPNLAQNTPLHIHRLATCNHCGEPKRGNDYACV